ALSHLTIVPDSIPCPSRGSFTSSAIRPPDPLQGQSPYGDDPSRRYELPSRCTVFWIASSTSVACGTTYSSLTAANGSGVNFAPTRSTGASSQSKAWCWTTAATSAPKPIRVTASCATTQRFVFFTEPTIAFSSSGCSVRGSTTSTETPCCSASSAAASASWTSLPVATTVTSSPWRCTRAWPIGIGSISSASSPFSPYRLRCSKKTTGLSS